MDLVFSRDTIDTIDTNVTYDPLFISAITVAEALAISMVGTSCSPSSIANAYITAFNGIMDGCAAKGEKK